MSGATLVGQHLEAQRGGHVFGVPGATLDRVYDSLLDSCILSFAKAHKEKNYGKKDSR